MPTIIAHRAGNNPTTARAAADLGYTVEIDAHLFRGCVEVRHEKVLWPTSRLWERWYLLPRRTRPVQMHEVVAVLDNDTPVLLDLKCFTPRAARRIRDSVPVSHPLAVSTRSWWLLKEFRSRSGTVTLRSCGTKWQLWLATKLPGLSPRDGIVAHERLLTSTAFGALTAKTPLIYCWAATSVERGRDLALAGIQALIVDDLELDWPGFDWPAGDAAV